MDILKAYLKNKLPYNYNIADWVGNYSCGTHLSLKIKKNPGKNSIIGTLGDENEADIGDLEGEIVKNLFLGNWKTKEAQGSFYFQKDSVV